MIYELKRQNIQWCQIVIKPTPTWVSFKFLCLAVIAAKTFCEIDGIDDFHNSFLSYYLSKIFLKPMLVFIFAYKKQTNRQKEKEK